MATNQGDHAFKQSGELAFIIECCKNGDTSAQHGIAHRLDISHIKAGPEGGTDIGLPQAQKEDSLRFQDFDGETLPVFSYSTYRTSLGSLATWRP